MATAADFVRVMAQASGFGKVLDVATLEPVSVEAMPPDLLEQVAPMLAPRCCYNNSFYVSEFFRPEREVRYCVGFAAGSIFPVGHAWVKIDGVYFDPTWQLFHRLGDLYVPFFELDPDRLMSVVIENDNRPPEAWEVARTLFPVSPNF